MPVFLEKRFDNLVGQHCHPSEIPMNISPMHIYPRLASSLQIPRWHRMLTGLRLHRAFLGALAVAVLACGTAPLAHGATITVDAHAVLGTIPAGQAWQTGAVLEDINHSVYGGIYSQLLFGERFMEPPPFPRPVGTWDLYNNGSNAENGVQWLSADPPKDIRFMWSYVNPTTIQSEGGLSNIMMNRDVSLTSGQIGFSICFPDYHEGGEGGLMFCGNASDPFSGMWLHLWDGGSFNVIGGAVAGNNGGTCPELAVGATVQVVLAFDGANLSVSLNGRQALATTYAPPAGSGGCLGFRTTGRWAQFSNLWIQPAGGAVQTISLAARSGADALAPGVDAGVSRMWQGFRTGTATAAYSLSTAFADRFGGTNPIGPNGGVLSSYSDAYLYSGAQLWGQVLSFTGGSGAVGLENRGLNRQGLVLHALRDYHGYAWVRMPTVVPFTVQLQQADGTILASQDCHPGAGTQQLTAATNGGTPALWQRFDFTLTPTAETTTGRFAIMLTQPGQMTIGHVFLEPGSWGLYHGQHVRKDIVDSYTAMGVGFLRFGGSQTNAYQFRWREQIGQPDLRPAIRGTYYNLGSNGFGLIEFLNLTQAMGIASSIAISSEESPADIGNFISYLNSSDSANAMVQQRIADGHPAPYGVQWIQIGNEQIIDSTYVGNFEALATAIWAADPAMILIASDYGYNGTAITDPFNCAASTNGSPTLQGQFTLMAFAQAAGRQIWFDTHIDTSVPAEPAAAGEISFTRWLGTGAGAYTGIAGGKYRVVVYECNATTRTMGRAIAAFNTPLVYQPQAVNFQATGAAAGSYGNIPIVCTANGLQADPWNDNGWDSGMILFSNATAFLSPTAYALQLHARNDLPQVLNPSSDDPADLMVGASTSLDGLSLMLAVSNRSASSVSAQISVGNYAIAGAVTMTRLAAAALSSGNELASPRAVAPVVSTIGSWNPTQALPPYSCTIYRFGPNQPIDHAPVADAQAIIAPPGVSTPVTLTATDPDGDLIVGWTIVSAPSKGTISGTAPFLTYRPNAGAAGSDALTFTASDGTLTSAMATITFTAGGGGVTTAPTIVSLAPASGPVGTAVAITGTNLTGSAAVTFNGTSAAFTVTSPTQIATSVPIGATTGLIAVTTPAGTATSATAFTVTVPIGLIHQYTFNDGTFSDGVGSANGTLNGTASISGGALRLPGGANGTAYGSLPPTVLRGLTSASLEGWFTITTFQTWSKIAFAGALDTSSFLGLTPASAMGSLPHADFLATGGSQETAVGSQLSTGTPCYFAVTYDADHDLQSLYAGNGGVLQPVMTSSMAGMDLSQVNIQAFYVGRSLFGGDQDFAGSLDELRIYDGVLAPSQIAADCSAGPTPTAGPSPTIASFSPSGAAPGTAVVISGTGFSGTTSVAVNGTAATFTVNSATEITAVIPAGATSGTIRITTPSGSATSATAVTVLTSAAAPTISGISAASGPPGSQITISGTNLTGTMTVSFAGTYAPFTVNSAGTQISATVPAQANSGPITIVTPNGSATSSASFTSAGPASSGSSAHRACGSGLFSLAWPLMLAVVTRRRQSARAGRR